MNNTQKVISMKTNVGNIDSCIETLLSYDSANKGFSVCVSNVHMCMEVYDSEDFAKVVNEADLVIPDGRPIYWAQKLLGNPDANQIRGQDIMERLCSLSSQRDIKIGLYGGSSDDVLSNVVSVLEKTYSGIKIVYQYSPPFRALTDKENHQVISNINESEVDVLFVGIGCPKQENWMHENRPYLNCVMLGVGAAYDFISGEKKHAPKWMQKVGFEWLFRLLSEPKRLWKRYFKHNPRFIVLILVQWLKGR